LTRNTVGEVAEGVNQKVRDGRIHSDKKELVGREMAQNRDLAGRLGGERGKRTPRTHTKKSKPIPEGVD